MNHPHQKEDPKIKEREQKKKVTSYFSTILVGWEKATGGIYHRFQTARHQDRTRLIYGARPRRWLSVI